MASFIHHDRIIERLEMARAMGLVTNYFVNPAGSVRRPQASVKVWSKAGSGDDAIKEHLARLLQGLVAHDQILIIAPFAAEAVASVGDKSAVPVAA